MNVRHQQAIEDFQDQLVDALHADCHPHSDHERRNVAEAVLDLVGAVRENTEALDRIAALLGKRLS